MNMTRAWKNLLREVLQDGREVSPRGRLTKELPQRTTVVDMRQPVLISEARGLSYKFMAAEAFWILSGDDRVDGIAPFNKNIAAFSDDGERFFGAYGPKIVGQLDYVVQKLVEDTDSRQAGLTIWRENPPTSKDIPCTVAIFFSIRSQRLNCHTFMRSSDCWLGVPYDVFNFSMVSHLVCARLWGRGKRITPGKLYLTAASAHLYEENFDGARACIAEPSTEKQVLLTPGLLHTDEHELVAWLEQLRYVGPGHDLRWWEEDL